MKPNISKCNCIWTACIAALAVALCTTMTTAYAGNNLGAAYISNVTSSTGNCIYSDTNGGGNQFWDIQAGGTYTITLSNATDCDQGLDSSIGVIVHNSLGGNIATTANQVNNQQGVYSFTITLTGQCQTMPIEYCATGTPLQPGTGNFAQDFNGTGGGGNVGHLRTTIFDGNCVKQGDDNSCVPAASPTPTPCVASITACKYYDFNTNGVKDTGEQGLANWPFCLTKVSDSSFAPEPQSGGADGCTTFSNLGPGTYIVTEGAATGYFGSTNSSTITIDHCDQNVTVNFGNYCTVPSNGLTLGFWSNKNGNKILTGNTSGTGRDLLPAVVALLNSPVGNGARLVNANGSIHTFVQTNGYADFRTWILGATATNMAYMLSAQLAALDLDVHFPVPPNPAVDGNAFDLCSGMTINALMTQACQLLHDAPYTPSGVTARVGEEATKNCIDAINNNGQVVPVTPCDHSSASVSCQ